MKNHLRVFSCALFFLIVLVPMVLLGSESEPVTPEEGDPVDYWNFVIPFLTPLVIAGIKMLAPRIPNPWLPVLAPMLGVGLDAITSALGAGGFDPLMGAALGLGGVGIRELIDQITKATQGIADNPAGSAAYVEEQKKAAGSSSNPVEKTSLS